MLNLINSKLNLTNSKFNLTDSLNSKLRNKLVSNNISNSTKNERYTEILDNARKNLLLCQAVLKDLPTGEKSYDFKKVSWKLVSFMSHSSFIYETFIVTVSLQVIKKVIEFHPYNDHNSNLRKCQ